MGHELDVVSECNKLIQLGSTLLNTIDSINYNEIEGLDKLTANIKKDILFLSKTLEKDQLKKDHVMGSVINQYNELLSYVSHANNCTAVLKAFRFESDIMQKKKTKLSVDVVSEGKKKWTKIIRRNAKALSLISLGEGDFGRKSIIDQAKEFTECAKQNPHFFKSPLVEFYFASGIEEALAKTLKDLGVHVTGKVFTEVPGDEPFAVSLDCSQPFQKQEITSSDRESVRKLNLDVNTMISYVSGLTNGETEMEFEGKIMAEQAKEERDCPLKPTLDRIFQGKELIACETAVRSFHSILEVQGGGGEKSRGEELLRRLEVVEDGAEDPGWDLDAAGVKRRAAKVFATGLRHGAVTVTASMGFINAIRRQGFDLDVIIHEPRSLSEVKGKKKAL